MNFSINKDATFPLLKLELIHNGKNDYDHFMDLLQNSDIYFRMRDIDTGRYALSMVPASCVRQSTNCDDCGIENYYLVYEWKPRDTKRPGTYVGEFIIDFADMDEKRLIVPIAEELFIYILDGSIKNC